MSCVGACPCGWAHISCTRAYLPSHILHLTPITINGIYERTLAGRRPHWMYALSERWGISILCVWPLMDFTVLWKYLAMKWEITIVNVHLPGRKEERKKEKEKEERSSRSRGIRSSCCQFLPLPLHSLIWEVLHLLLAIVQHGNKNEVPV